MQCRSSQSFKVPGIILEHRSREKVHIFKTLLFKPQKAQVGELPKGQGWTPKAKAFNSTLLASGFTRTGAAAARARASSSSGQV